MIGHTLQTKNKTKNIGNNNNNSKRFLRHASGKSTLIIFLHLLVHVCEIFFFLWGFSLTHTDNLQDSIEKDGTIFYFTLLLPPSHEQSVIYLQLSVWGNYHIYLIASLVITRLLRTFRHIFATLHVRWLSHIFNHIACIYQTATRWDLPYCSIIWLTDDVILIFICLLDDLILGFVAAIWHGNPVDWNLHRLSLLYYKRTD